MSSINAQRIINRNEIQVIEEDISCPICKMIIIDPIQCRQCESPFCYECGEQCQQSKGSCPICIYSQHSPFYTLTVSRIFKNLLSKVQLECLNHFDGCEESVNLNNYRNHRQTCQYRRQQCQNLGCNKLFLHYESLTHLVECQFIEVACKYCKKTIIKKDLKDHQEECPMQLLPCQWCKISYLLRDMTKHCQSCELKKIPCLECHQVFIRRDYKQHSREDCQMYLYKEQFLICSQLFKKKKCTIDFSTQQCQQQ